MVDPREIAALLHSLTAATSPLERARMLARGWRTIGRMSPRELKDLAREDVELKLLASSKFIGEDENGQNDATVLGFGAGITARFMRTSSLDLAARYYTGNSDQDTVSLKGFSATISARVVF